MVQVTINETALGLEADEETGKPALVLSHPLGADLRCWESVLPALRETFRVIRYDVRGHGWSAPGDVPPSVETFGRDVVAILDHLGIARAHFVGVSMGGAIGQWLMVHAPERIEKVVLANTAARLGSPDSWNERIRQALSDGMAAGADATINRWLSEGFVQDHPEHVSSLREVLEGMSATGYAGACAALRDMDFRQALHGASTPVLVLTGDEDAIVSEDDTALLLAALPQAQHVSLSARHMPLIETPEVFADTLIKFLTSKVAPAKSRGRPASRSATVSGRGSARRPAIRTAGSARTSVAKASPRPAARRAAPSAPTSKAKPIAKRAQLGKAAVRKVPTPVRKAEPATKARSAARSSAPTAARAAGRRTAPAQPVASAKKATSKEPARAPTGKVKAQVATKGSAARAPAEAGAASRVSKTAARPSSGRSTAASSASTPTRSTKSIKTSASKPAASSKGRAAAAKSTKLSAAPKNSTALKPAKGKKGAVKATAASLRKAAAQPAKRTPTTRSSSPSRGGSRRGKP